MGRMAARQAGRQARCPKKIKKTEKWRRKKKVKVIVSFFCVSHFLLQFFFYFEKKKKFKWKNQKKIFVILFSSDEIQKLNAQDKRSVGIFILMGTAMLIAIAKETTQQRGGGSGIMQMDEF